MGQTSTCESCGRMYSTVVNRSCPQCASTEQTDTHTPN